MIKTEWKVLVVEDDKNILPSMKAALERNATLRDLNVHILHAVNMYEARRHLDTNQIDGISTDMGYPPRFESHVESDMGARLARFLMRYKKIPYLIYSGMELGDVKKALAEFGVTDFPEILHKSRTSDHTQWARSTLDLLLVRPQ
jgi:CheY-like chemotaxis protein